MNTDTKNKISGDPPPRPTPDPSNEGNGKEGKRIEVTAWRSWRVPLTPEEIGLHTWVTRAARVRLADYLRAALDEKARSTVKELIACGKKVPPWVAKMLDKG